MTSLNKGNNHLEFKLSNKNLWLLWGCQLANIITLSAEISTWMLITLSLCLAGKAYLNTLTTLTGSIRKYYSVVIKILALTGCIVIGITAPSNGILISMVHLITFAYVLKSFEIKKRSDFYQLILLGLFLLASALIFQQSLLFSVLIIFVFVANLIVLMQIFSPNKSIISTAKTLCVLISQSLILAIVLFIVFPRLSPFWQVPNSKSSQTGLSDVVSPGDIANLALSSDLAFRVDFKGQAIPSYSNLYWRAMTLENYDGKKWSKVNRNKGSRKPQNTFKPEVSGESITYNVIVEPSYQKWLFGLSVITTDNSKLILKNDYTVQSRDILSQISHYQLTSFLNAPLDTSLHSKVKEINLEIVKGSNPKLEELASNLIDKYPQPLDRSNAILALFRQENYFYTLSPPLLENNSLDQFFFSTKAGFCVHYASTYTYLMRAAGIPARVVTGYLGGEYNNTNDSSNSKQQGHLSVYQYDAHAWSEIWIEGQGWKRIDPTATVDPQRVESGWSTDLLTQQSSLNNDLLGLYQLKKIAWLNSLRLQFDLLDYQWTKWVLGYSSKKQYDLLKSILGVNVNLKAGGIIAVSFILITLLFTFISSINFRQWFKRKEVSPVLQLYQCLIQEFAKQGMTKYSNMTTSNYAKQVAELRPDVAKEFYQFTKYFELLMYAHCNDNDKASYILSMKNIRIKIKSRLKISKKN